MSTTEPASQQDRIVRLALLAGRRNLIVQAARQHVADHHHDEPCDLCAALATYDRGAHTT